MALWTDTAVMASYGEHTLRGHHQEWLECAHQGKCDVSHRPTAHERHGQNRLALFLCILPDIYWPLPSGAPNGLSAADDEHSRDDFHEP